MSQKVLTIHAEISMIDFPLAATAAKFDTYMNDMIKSLETQLVCCQLVRELQPLIQGIDMKVV
jgi:hypothetical protein